MQKTTTRTKLQERQNALDDKVELVSTNVEKGRGLGEKNATFDIRLDAGNNLFIYMMFKSCQYVAEFRDRPRGL